MPTVIRRTVDQVRQLGMELAVAWGAVWRRSLQLRVVISTLALSTAVVLVLGFVIQTQIAGNILQAKLDDAQNQIESGAALLERELASVDPNREGAQGELNNALDRLTNSSDASGTPAAGAFRAVLATTAIGANSSVAAGPLEDVPSDLRQSVADGARAGAVRHRRLAGHRRPRADDRPAGAHRERRPGVLPAVPARLGAAHARPRAEHADRRRARAAAPAGGHRQHHHAAGRAARCGGPRRSPSGSPTATSTSASPVQGEDELARLGESYNEMAGSIQEQIRQLEEFGALQRRFTSDVSHELRTPLTTVRMAADVPLRLPRRAAPRVCGGAPSCWSPSWTGSSRCSATCWRSPGSTRVSPSWAPSATDMHAWSCARGRARAGAGRRDRAPPLRAGAADRVYADVDPRRVERIVRNLVANAIDHSEAKPVRVMLAADEHAVAVLVRDHGVGLRPGEASLVFNRFWRAEESRARRTGGTGLGLSIAVEDARLHGGWLQAWGEPGKGAVFRLTLPRNGGDVLESSPLPLGPEPDTAAPGRHVRPRRRRSAGRPSSDGVPAGGAR